MKQSIKAILFDFDGTLADTLPLCIRAFQKTLALYATRSYSEKEITDTFGPSEDGTIQALIPEHFEEGVESYLHYYQQMHDMCPTLFEGLKALLDELKNHQIPMGIVTGKGPRSMAISLNYYGLEDYFDAIDHGWIHGPRKVAGISAILDKWSSIDPQHVWYVGDSAIDVRSAKEAGIPVVGAGWAEATDIAKLENLQPDQLFTSVQEFAQWVRQATT